MSAVLKFMTILLIVTSSMSNNILVNGDEDASLDDLKQLKAMYVAAVSGGKRRGEVGCEGYNDAKNLASEMADVSPEELKEKDGFRKKKEVHEKINQMKGFSTNWCGFSEAMDCVQDRYGTFKKCKECPSNSPGCNTVIKIANAKDWKSKKDSIQVISLIKISRAERHAVKRTLFILSSLLAVGLVR